MSDNKFILQLKGQQTPKSVVEIKNDKLVAPFVNVPGSSDSVGGIIQDKDSSVVVARGAQNWKIEDGALVPATNLTGNGADFTGEYSVSGSGLWVNAVYTFPTTGDPRHPVAEIFNAQTKWVLQLCGKNLLSNNGNTIDFSFIVKIGTTNIMTKNITVRECANFFCRHFVLDFSESAQSIIKAQGGANLTVQLLCADPNASATIYNGMSVLTALQRRIDASAISADFANVEEVLRDGILPSDYFSNTEFIDQIEDGEDAYAVFTRDGDSVNLSGWTPKDEIATKEMVIVKSPTMPEPNADLLGAMYQYVGETSGAFEHAYIYECTLTPADTLIFTPNTMSCSWEDLSTFLQTITPDYNNVVKGSMTYLFAGDLWKLEVLDENDSVIATYQQYTPDWENVGFSFVGTPQDGDVVSFVKTSNDTYNWVRTDVQPGGSRGRFLSLWDCTTGLAESNPPISPYEYKTGDYFIVGKVSTATPPVNYKPDGTSYVTGQASSAVETNEVAVDDTYFFDGTTWRLQSNSNKTVTYSNIAGDIYDNASAANALNNKVNKTSTASQVYATDSNGAQTTLTYGAGIVNGGLVQRGGTSGQIQVPATPTNNVHATSKQYVDNALADKVDKVNTATVLYGTTSGGEQTTLSYGASVSDLMIVRRPVGGQINVPLAPTDNAHATSKKYVDDGLAGKQDTISDLATIRSGAAAGATAVQPGDNVSDLTNDAGYLVMSDLTNFVTRTTAQTISGLKTFSADIALSGTTSIKNTTNGVSYTMMYRDTSGIHVGTSTQALLLAGSGTHPSFNGNNLALLSEIPTVPTTLAALTGDVDISTPTNGQHLVYDGAKWKNTSSAATVSWGGIIGTLSDQADLQNALYAKADVATTYNKTEVDTIASGKANTDMDNLTSTGQNIANWSHNVSNCITEIPQDIKLELNNGTLTLKAGSKVYVPNGVGVFDEITIASDITISTAGGATKYMLFYNRTTGSVWFAELVYQNSGTTPSGDGFYYNTSINKTVFLRSGVADPYEFSLPIGIVTSDSTKYTSINQVFNGFGYIGSTIFALPGVKALISDYRNTDRTLKNMPVTVSSVRTLTITDVSRSDIWVFLTDVGMTVWGSSGGNVREYKTRPASAPQTYVRAYIEDENHWIHCLNSTTWETINSDDNIVKLFSVNSDANGKISGIFDWNTPFHAVDYNDMEFIGHQAMPTNEGSIDLTIGSSGSSYFAPADGYFNFRGYGYSVEIYRNDMHVGVMYPQEEWGAVIMPVSKGQRITVLYNLTGDKNLRFYYANGSV